MRPGSSTGRRHIDLARIGFCVGDEFRDRSGWNRWIDHHDIGSAANARDWRNVTDEIESGARVERDIDRTRRHDLHEERVTVRRGSGDEFGGGIAGGTGPVFNDELLAEPLR